MAERESFLQRMSLLIVTAALTGIMVPYINSRVGEERMRRSEQEAARIAREASVIRAQEEYLAELEKTLFDFNMRAAAVPWYASVQSDAAKFKTACAAYDEASWQFWGQMGVLTSKGRRLTSRTAYAKFTANVKEWNELDTALVNAIQQPQTPAQWKTMLDRVNTLSVRTEAMLEALAQDYGLTPKR